MVCAFFIIIFNFLFFYSYFRPHTLAFDALHLALLSAAARHVSSLRIVSVRLRLFETERPF